MPIELPRRALLGSAGAIVLGITLPGCSTGGQAAPAAPPPTERAGNSLATTVSRQSAGLVGRYNATVTAHPSLAGLLGPLRSAAAADLDGPGVPEEPAPPGAGEAEDAGRTAPNNPDNPGPPDSGVPDEPDAALAALATEEQRVSEARLRALDAAPAETARLLASLSAAGAARSYLLTGARG
ncbi:hypothetical protein FNQ90_20635 [Streptomyces alkaliphilus]|uniref:Lipoprotein n=1 Tax=Streptomyces alkaliphilus TaxID=1472722 RepID=A0A7W3TGK7_9ACTN|nr:hypothetical protein [Streptomyces alkaliphilus]MBB0246453.1 hypothetical protein [Streptomyces alkaliphilus]